MPRNVALLITGCSCFVLLVVFPVWPSPAVNESPFWIKVVDDETGRGVPLVRLTTTDNQAFITDSNGIAAIDAPGLKGETVWFSVTSEGYKFRRTDFAGQPGFKTRVRYGDSSTIKISRQNIARRLYRKTGRGIYADSIKVGAEVPLEFPLLNAGVMGQDSVQAAVFRGRIFWFYGDTKLPFSRFGVFKATGATSPLPGQGGLPPQQGVNQSYFTDDRGFARALLPQFNSGAVWLSRLMVLVRNNQEQLFTRYVNIRPKSRFKAQEHGIARWSTEKKRFVPIMEFPLNQPFPINRVARGHPQAFRVRENGQEWFYFANPYPTMRVPANRQSILDPGAYRIFTPLKPGTQSFQGWSSFNRDQTGDVQWAWQKLTMPLDPPRGAKLTDKGTLDNRESIFHLRGVDSGRSIVPVHGSVYWNPYRKKWIMITVEAYGESSRGGETWYAEADSPLGPWVYARKIVTHDSHTLYNPNHHPFLNQNHGRTIFFEGTYSSSFNPHSQKIPRYNYNQVMYSLDLRDTRLHLPTPVYRETHQKRNVRYGTSRTVSADPLRSTVPFYALSPNRKLPGTIPVWETKRSVNGSTRTVLTTRPNDPFKALNDPAFYALPDDRPGNPAVEPLYQYRTVRGSRVTYRTPSNDPGISWRQRGEPLVFVWKSPRIDPPRNPAARPVLTCRGASAHCDSTDQNGKTEIQDTKRKPLQFP